MKKLFLVLAAGGFLMFSSCSKTGPQGPAGNANVIGENPFTISGSQWSYDAASLSYFVTVTDGNITADVQNYGLVEVYKEYNNGWTNLPDIYNGVATFFNFATGAVTISVDNVDGSLPTNPGSVNFRIVVVPSSVKQANPNANWSNYNETMAILNRAKTATTTNSNL